MALTINSTRFGTVEIPSEAVVEFPTGLIGLGGSRYALIARDETDAFLWLHSVDDPSLALPVTNPLQFFPGYEVILSDGEAERLGLTESSPADIYVTVRTGPTLEEFMVNLRAPILVREGKGHQVINEAPDTPVRTPLFPSAALEAAA